MIPTPADPRELGLETTAELRAMIVRSPHKDAPINRLLRDFDRQSAEIDRLTAALSEARAAQAAYVEMAAVAREEEREACAKIADSYGDTKPNLEKSDNPTTARAIATIMSDTGRRVAAAIRARSHL